MEGQSSEDMPVDDVRKILIGAWHRGGGQAVYPPARKIAIEGYAMISLVTGPSIDVFKDLPFKTPESYGFVAIGPEEAKRIIEAEQPSAVLIGTSSQDKDTPITLEQALTLAAKEMNIPTIAVLDLWGNYTRRFSDMPTFDNKKYLPSKICVPDNIAYDEMIREGFDSDTLAITGNPYFDDIAQSKQQFTTEQRQTLRAGLHKHVLLFASQPIEFHYGTALGYTEKTALQEILLSIPDNTTIIIRPHPKENPEELRAVAESTNAHYIIDAKTPLQDAIMASDIILSPFSTILIDAALLGVPAISLQPGLIKEDFLPTNKLGITYPVLKHGQIGDVVRAFLSTTGLRQQFEERAKSIAPDGHATERVVQEIYNVLG